MADDAMDWNPITPPPLHNPYYYPQYMPGGWPESPYPFQITTGVFARKGPPTLVARTAKRVCTGARTAGTIATLPFKPIYLIIRHLRDRTRSGSRLSRRESTQNRRLTPAVRAHLATAEQIIVEQVAKATQDARVEPQQIPTPPSTPPSSRDVFDIALSAVASHLADQESTSVGATNTETTHLSPSAISVTNTETTIQTLLSVKKKSEVSPLPQRKANAKRCRDTEQEAIDEDGINFMSINEQKPQIQTSELVTPPQAKKMKGANPFVAGYKRDPTAYGSRGLTAGRRLRAIGSRTKTPRKGLDFWGGYEYERPIGAASALSTSEQSQSEQDSSLPERGQVSESPQALPEDQESSAEPTSSKEPISKQKLSHDERWSSVCVVEAYPYDDCYEEKKSLPEQHASGEPQDGSEEKLFYGKRTVELPPRVRIRPIVSTELSQVIRKEEAEQNGQDKTTATESKIIPGETIKNEDALITQHAEQVDGKVTTEKSNSQHIGIESYTTDITEDNVDATVTDSSDTFGTKPATVSTTPLKVIAKNPAKAELETPAMNLRNTDFETPAEKLSMLKIEDAGDNDTPKATPHSGTKTTRVTRYREALEKAQKAKLEQFEIVPISDDWDRKVRKAIRQGIPDYLGPQDLARVVPQYASFGQDNWLNDETINKYLELVAEHGRKNDRADQVRSHHTFNNFFYNNLRSKGPESVSRWSKRAKIGGTNLSYVEKVFVPINSGAHWTLAVVEPTQKKITHYNSMRGSGTGVRACEDLKAWVALEQGKTFKEEEWTLTAVGESPQQTNSDDCGVFTITSARQIMLGYTPMSYGPSQIPTQRIRIVAELINRGLLRSTDQA